jgi:hypothetical protein
MAEWFRQTRRLGGYHFLGVERKDGGEEEIGGKTERPSGGVEKGTKTVE